MNINKLYKCKNLKYLIFNQIDVSIENTWSLSGIFFYKYKMCEETSHRHEY